MAIRLKRFSLELVENCQEVQAWLDQFPGDDRITATNLLLRLQFVPRDTYSEWLKATILNLTPNPCALYAVRKFDEATQGIWGEAGSVVGRPSSSLGSEDLVHSVISSVIKSHSRHFQDHPSLEDIKSSNVHDIALIDDSIGSGQRVYTFIQMMMRNRTFLSWWSFGWINLHIIAFARTIEGTKRIIEETPGSDHAVRRFPKSQKIHFKSLFSYQASLPQHQWGRDYQNIINLCDSQRSLPAWCRRGFDETMANIIFYHSVPNNTPGVLWKRNRRWAPLFPQRSVPEWLPRLLETNLTAQNRIGMGDVPEYLLTVLLLVKKGIRNESSLARIIGFDTSVMKQIVSRARASGFLTAGNRLTEAGRKLVWAEDKGKHVDCFNRTLYIPTAWCVGGGTVQPSALIEQTESADGSPSADGEAR